MSRRDPSRLTMYSTPSGSGTALAAEEQPLLGRLPGDAGRAHDFDDWEDDDENDDDDDDEYAADREKYILRFLPVAFTAVLAMTATGISSMIVYDRIACPDGFDCGDMWRLEYYRTLEVARTVANACGVLSVGIARIWVESDPKLCLYLWLSCRALGICVLLLGYFLSNIYVAASSSVLDGLANGNILYFVLAAVYVRTRVPGRFARLVGTSLALYLVGCAVGPWAPALVSSSLLFSFAATLVLLGLTAVYLAVFIPSSGIFATESDAPPSAAATTRRRAIVSAMVSPFYYLYAESAVRLPALALLLHHTTQGFLFIAIIVHAVIDLGFYGLQNGIVFGIETAVPAVYLMLALFGVPGLQRMWKRGRRATEEEDDDVDDAASEAGGSSSSRSSISEGGTRRSARAPSNRDFVCTIVCMLAQLVALPWFLAVTEESSGAVYGLVAVASVGMAAPAFLKSYAVSIVDAKTSALGTLTLMESFGALIAPLLVTSFQFWYWRNAIVILAPSLVGASLVCLVASYLLAR
ncbi:hypothetical protein PG991_012060 [Apiospora marii]|uniref:Major facilitator superfamily (MFS) profile domain-containing protein n=1 Tax=Apiospora marii TaxID=335849 RepID=A0ABR1RFY2_9PEZI